MTAPNGVSSTEIVTAGQNYNANTDYEVQVTGVTLPSAVGGYGPFKIITR